MAARYRRKTQKAACHNCDFCAVFSCVSCLSWLPYAPAPMSLTHSGEIDRRSERWPEASPISSGLFGLLLSPLRLAAAPPNSLIHFTAVVVEGLIAKVHVTGRSQLHLRCLRVKRSSYHLILPKAQARRMLKTVLSAAEPIQSTCILLTTEMLRSGLNRNGTTSTFFRTKRNAACQSHDLQLLHP
jgi:hypothetical protein